MAPRQSTLSRLWQHRRLPRLRWLALLALVLVIGLGVGVGVLVRHESGTETYFACYTNGRVSQVGTTKPRTCPPGGGVIRGKARIDGPIESFGRRATAQLRGHLTIPDVMIALSVVSLIWILAGWRIDDTWLLLAWVAVPVGAVVAAACVAGPGHWFPKEPYEGPSVIPLGANDAITALDLVGIAVASLTLLAAVLLVAYRRRRSPLV